MHIVYVVSWRRFSEAHNWFSIHISSLILCASLFSYLLSTTWASSSVECALFRAVLLNHVSFFLSVVSLILHSSLLCISNNLSAITMWLLCTFFRLSEMIILLNIVEQSQRVSMMQPKLSYLISFKCIAIDLILAIQCHQSGKQSKETYFFLRKHAFATSSASFSKSKYMFRSENGLKYLFLVEIKVPLKINWKLKFANCRNFESFSHIFITKCALLLLNDKKN